MPAITDRSDKAPLLKIGRMNHGTLHCSDIVKTRRFYEEILGLEVVQTSAASLLVRKGTDHVYAVVEAPMSYDMNLLNHNGFEVDTREEVDAAYNDLQRIKDEWGLKKINPIKKTHGAYTFYFMDFDGKTIKSLTSASQNSRLRSRRRANRKSNHQVGLALQPSRRVLTN